MSSSTPKEYEHVQLEFGMSSACLDGKSYEVTAYMLVPVEVLSELQQWREEAAKGSKASGYSMYKTLQTKGALLHREDGPAYKEVEKSMFDRTYAKVSKEQYWEKGIQKSSATPLVKPLGKYTL